MSSFLFHRRQFLGFGLGLAWSAQRLSVAATADETHEVADATKPTNINIKVLVLNFDPITDKSNGTRLHETCGWQDPQQLAQGYIEDLQQASNGLLRYAIVQWQDLDEFPIKADGFRYSLDEYLQCHRAGTGWHAADGADYPQTIADHSLIPRIESREVDEVWWFGGPYFGFFESAMAGRDAFYINGDVFGWDQVRCNRPFAIMGFNYERGVAEMLHSMCHRVEATVSRAFGGWKAEDLNHDWARFAANATQSGGEAAVGSCHYPPNGASDYDYSNPRFVESTADDWLNYPHLTGKKQKVNCETWGGPDYHRNYMRWWYARLPRAAGKSADGQLNNWWDYVFHFQNVPGRP